MARTPARKAAPLDLDALLPVRDRTLRWREPDSNYWSRDGETPLGTQCGLRARLHQLGEALIPGETKSSNPVSSSGESCKPPIPRRVLSLGGTARHQRFAERLPPRRADPEGRLAYAGRAGTGISHAELERLWRRL